MKKNFCPVLFIFISIFLLLSSCGERENGSLSVPRPEPTVEYDCGSIDSMLELLGKTQKKAKISDESIKYVNNAPFSALVKGSFMGEEASGTLYFTGTNSEKPGIVDSFFFMFHGISYEDAAEYLSGIYGEPTSTGQEPFSTGDGAIRWSKYETERGSVKVLSGSKWDFVDITVSRVGSN